MELSDSRFRPTSVNRFTLVNKLPSDQAYPDFGIVDQLRNNRKGICYKAEVFPIDNMMAEPEQSRAAVHKDYVVVLNIAGAHPAYGLFLPPVFINPPFKAEQVLDGFRLYSPAVLPDQVPPALEL